jgi:hypothetical protein
MGERGTGWGNWTVAFEVSTVAERTVLAILAVAVVGVPSARRDGHGFRACIASGDVTDGLGRSAEGVVERGVVGDSATGASKVTTVATRAMETVLVVGLASLPGIARDRELQELALVAWRDVTDVDLALGVGIAGVSFLAFVGDSGTLGSSGGSIAEVEAGGSISGGDATAIGVFENVVTAVTTRAMAVLSRVVIGRVGVDVAILEVRAGDVDSVLHLPGVETDGDGVGVEWVAWRNVADGDLLATDWYRAGGDGGAGIGVANTGGAAGLTSVGSRSAVEKELEAVGSSGCEAELRSVPDELGDVVSSRGSRRNWVTTSEVAVLLGVTVGGDGSRSFLDVDGQDSSLPSAVNGGRLVGLANARLPVARSVLRVVGDVGNVEGGVNGPSLGVDCVLRPNSWGLSVRSGGSRRGEEGLDGEVSSGLASVLCNGDDLSNAEGQSAAGGVPQLHRTTGECNSSVGG